VSPDEAEREPRITEDDAGIEARINRQYGKHDQRMTDDLICSIPARFWLCIKNEAAPIGHIFSHPRTHAV
jgi:hypothetical protein